MVAGHRYAIWSNSLGCFDNEHAEFGDYVYFAGDSFTWGYTDFDKKFGMLVEKITGTQILKCGVTHTGQIHQYEKLLEIVDQISQLPKAIFVFYVPNDVANDFAHPHSTVIDGWQVDNVFIGSNNQLVHKSDEELRVYLEKRTGKLKEKRIFQFLRNYSFSSNLFIQLKQSVARLAAAMSPSTNGIASLRKFYELPIERNGVYWYSDNIYAQRNKSALIDFQTYSIENKIPFLVVLIPPQAYGADPNWYAELRDFLENNAISYIDIAIEFRKKELDIEDLYWEGDGHLNIPGNRIVAEILIEKLHEVLE